MSVVNATVACGQPTSVTSAVVSEAPASSDHAEGVSLELRKKGSFCPPPPHHHTPSPDGFRRVCRALVGS